MYCSIKLSRRVRLSCYFVGIVMGLLMVTLTPPPLALANTVTCDDGGGGINGYTSDSSCAAILQAYTCSHSDTPGGPIDTLSCSEPVPDTDGDGVPDATDPCPYAAGSTSCPQFPDQPFDGDDDDCDQGSGDPVSLLDGSWYWNMSCLKLRGKGIPINFSLRYNTRAWHNNLGNDKIGPGWLTSYSRRLVPMVDNGSIIALDLETANSIVERYYPLSGQPNIFKGDNNNYTTITKQGNGTYILERRDGVKDYFDSAGNLTKIRDRFSNEITFSWNGNTFTIQNTRTNRSIKLIHTTVGGSLKLTRIEDTTAAARELILNYNSNGQLQKITDADNKVHEFRYDSQGRIYRYFDPEHPTSGSPTVEMVYDSQAPYRVTRQTLANGNKIDFEWLTLSQATSGWDMVVTHNQGTSDERVIRYDHLDFDDQDYGFGPIKRIYNPNSTTAYTHMTYVLGQLASITDPEGRRTEYSYNNDGDLLSVRVCGNSACSNYDETTMTYNSYGQMTSVIRPTGEKMQWTYNGSTGAVTNVKQVNSGGSTTYTTIYDVNNIGLLLGVKLPDNTWHRQAYDSLGHPTTLTLDANYGGNSGRLHIASRTTNFDDRGFLMSETNAYGTTTSYEYNDKGWLLATVMDNANGGTTRTTYSYDDVGNLTQIKEDVGGLNLTTTYIYELVGTGGQYTVTRSTNAENNVVWYEYNRNGQLVKRLENSVRNSSGSLFTRQTTYTYTPEGWLDTIKAHDNRVVINYDYNDAGQIIQETDARGVRNEYTYDAKGRLYQKKLGTASVAGNSAVNAIYTYEYDSADHLTRVNGPNGWFVKYTFDNFGRLQSEEDALGNKTTYHYDNRNRISKTIRGDNVNSEEIVTQLEFDRIDRIVKLREDPTGLNLTTQYIYDVGEASDKWNRRRIIDPKGNVTNYSYNAFGRVSEMRDAANEQWLYFYDDLGRLIKRRDPLAIADGSTSNRDTTYQVDGLGRIERITRNNKNERWTYNADGSLRYYYDLGNRRTSYYYDTSGRLAKVQYPSGSNSAGQVTYVYESNDLLQGMTDKYGTTTYTYDALNRLKERTRNGRTVTYDYTKNSWVSNVAYWGEGNVSYSYDTAGRLSHMNPWSSGNISFDYTSANLLQEQERPGNVDTSYSYDKAGRLTLMETKDGSSPLHKLTYPTSQRDNNGNIKQMVETFNGSSLTTDYSYDALNRLTSAEYPAIPSGPDAIGENYSYDEVGNRVNVSNILPSGWNNTDIGPVDTAGNASYDNGVFTVNGSGDDFLAFGTSSDEMHFVYQALTGNGEIIAKLDMPAGIDGVAGIALRETLASTGRHVSAYFTQGASFSNPYWGRRYRPTAYTANSTASSYATTHPTYQWLKIQRIGNEVKALFSVDGSNWEEFHLSPSVTLSNLASTVYVGIFVHSGQTGLSQAQFSNVSVSNQITLNGSNYLVNNKIETSGRVSNAIVLLLPLLGVGIIWQRRRYGQWRQMLTLVLAAILVVSTFLPAFVSPGYASTGPKSYDANDRLTGTGYQYESAGNLKNDGVTTYTYDTANRLIGTVGPAGTIQYKYDGHGNLIQVTDNGTVTDLVIDERTSLPLILGEVRGGNTTLYAYGRGLAAVRQNSTARYPLLDHQGSVRHLTNSGGSLTDSIYYDAWGQVRYQTGNNAIRLGYTGEWMGADNTIFLRARHYKPALGRFLQRDTVNPAFLGRGAQGHHRYSYVENNPVMYRDPTGHTTFVPQPTPAFPTPSISVPPINLPPLIPPTPTFDFDEDCLPINWPQRPPTPPSNERPYNPGNPFRDPFNTGLEPGMTPEDLQNAPGNAYDPWENPSDYPELTPAGEASYENCSYGVCVKGEVNYHPTNGGTGTVGVGVGYGGGTNFGAKDPTEPMSEPGVKITGEASAGMADDAVVIDIGGFETDGRNTTISGPGLSTNVGTSDAGITVDMGGGTDMYGGPAGSQPDGGANIGVEWTFEIP